MLGFEKEPDREPGFLNQVPFAARNPNIPCLSRSTQAFETLHNPMNACTTLSHLVHIKKALFILTNPKKTTL